ncbi:tetraspanin-15-like [Rana temporaria]|uniref:tetraspanin-15-like n=1 Tax=Rana temporaria TaxID=8407 RepID=UPI001AAC6330|nr:tetraspanin-15-like [Rana temporaria]
MSGRHTWRDTLRSYYCIKFSLSFYSTLFSLIGLLILCIGIYAESERRKHQTLEGIFLAPAIILLLLGILMFVVSFIGMVGSLRDNLALLKAFFWVLLVIFIIELLLIVIELVFENQLKKFAHANILVGMKHYYDDLDFKNIMDFVQEKFSCCGGEEFRDWEVNPYHSCNSTGPLSCGVPYTCCITGKDSGGVKNTLCGYQTLDKERLDVAHIIHVRGCIHGVGLWLNDNFWVTFGLAIGLLAPQALGLCLSYLFWMKLKDICSNYDEVDFRSLKLKDFNFKELDLSGAGCCLCFPREEGYIPVNADSDDEKLT